MRESARILIVGDALDGAISEAVFASGTGYQVATAPSGKSALCRWDSLQPNMVILPVTPFEGDGLDTLHQIRERSTVPVIALSSVDDDEVIIRTLDAGADQCLPLPVRSAELQARIGALLRWCGWTASLEIGSEGALAAGSGG